MGMRRYGQFLAAFSLVAGLTAPALAQTDLRIGSGFGDAHSSTRAIRDVFASQVEKNTNGRYKVSVFATSQLGQAPEMVNQTQHGITFGVFVSSAFFNSQVPQLGVTLRAMIRRQPPAAIAHTQVYSRRVPAPLLRLRACLPPS